MLLVQRLIRFSAIGKCAGDTVYTLKDWCDINNQQQQQQFHHQALHQKGGWNNFGPIADWTSIDPAIVSSSRPLPFQTTSTWQFSHIHPSHTVTHNAQQVLRVSWSFPVESNRQCECCYPSCQVITRKIRGKFEFSIILFEVFIDEASIFLFKRESLLISFLKEFFKDSS